MTTPIRAHIREGLEAMWNTMVDFFFLRVRFGIRLANTFGNNLGIAFLMASIFAVFALHAG